MASLVHRQHAQDSSAFVETAAVPTRRPGPGLPRSAPKVASQSRGVFPGRDQRIVVSRVFMEVTRHQNQRIVRIPSIVV